MDASEPAYASSADGGAHGIGKRRRKKPTLNCSTCVERKSRCDRVRPKCTQCIRRQSHCRYTDIADILHHLGPQKAPQRQPSVVGAFTPERGGASLGQPTGSMSGDSGESSTSPYVVPKHQCNRSDAAWPHVEPTAIHAVLNADDEHPFQNYWTQCGGLPEVLKALPGKEQAFALVANFFDSIGPLYPVVSHSLLMMELDAFWSLSPMEMQEYAADKLALHFVIYAAGVQASDDVGPDERDTMAKFYLSASHQCLCLCSYLSRFTFGTMQTMLLIGYLLINTYRFWEAWTFSGILVRQAHGSQLHCSSSSMSVDQIWWERQLRRMMWQAITIQDINLAFYLQLPPSAVQSEAADGNAAPGDEPTIYSTRGLLGSEDDFPISAELAQETETDCAYLHSFSQYAAFVQQYVCIPLALKRPLSTSPAHRASLISRFRGIYSAWPAPFNSLDSKRFERVDHRRARQLIAVSSNFFGVLAVLHMDADPAINLQPDVHGAIDATHEALSSFFALLRLRSTQADMWGGYHTRAYSQAIRLGNLLAAETQQGSQSSRDPRFMLAKSDLDRYLDTLRTSQGSAKHCVVQVTRYQNLQRLLETIHIG